MTPISEAITLAIVALLESITAGEDYPMSVAGVNRQTRLGTDTISTQDRVVTLVQRERERDEPGESEGGGSQLYWKQHYVAVCPRRPSDESAVAEDTLLNEFAACVEKALMTDAQLSAAVVTPGVVIDTIVDRVGPIDPIDGAYIGPVVECTVTYRHPRTGQFVVVVP